MFSVVRVLHLQLLGCFSVSVVAVKCRVQVVSGVAVQ